MTPTPATTTARPKPKPKWRQVLRETWTRLRGGEITPARVAASVAVGLAIGVTPLWGTHVFLVLAVCVPFKLDSAIAYIASNISLPFIAPFITFAEIEIGARALTGHWMKFGSPADLRAHAVSPMSFLRELVVGTLIFSPAIATVGYGGTYAFARWIEKRLEAGLGPLLNRVAERYARGRRHTRVYVRTKMAGDPVVRAVLDLGGSDRGLGAVVDVGCGRGQLDLALVEGGGAATVHGIDWDDEKVEEARAAASFAPALDDRATFERADVRKADIPACDTVLFIDILHYLPPTEQDDLLERAAKAARDRVLLRELDPNRGWRSFVTRAQEAVTTVARFNRGARLVHRPIPDLAAPLEAAGFVVEVKPCWQGTPFSNVLVIATRPRR